MESVDYVFFVWRFTKNLNVTRCSCLLGTAQGAGICFVVAFCKYKTSWNEPFALIFYKTLLFCNCCISKAACYTSTKTLLACFRYKFIWNKTWSRFLLRLIDLGLLLDYHCCVIVISTILLGSTMFIFIKSPFQLGRRLISAKVILYHKKFSLFSKTIQGRRIEKKMVLVLTRQRAFIYSAALESKLKSCATLWYLWKAAWPVLSLHLPLWLSYH